MAEKILKFRESKERIPTKEQVRLAFDRLIGKEYTEGRSCEDEKGLYFWEVFIPGDSPNGMTACVYKREGNYLESQSSTTQIEIVYLIDNSAVGGNSPAALYIDGKWEIIP